MQWDNVAGSEGPKDALKEVVVLPVKSRKGLGACACSGMMWQGWKGRRMR